jgi:hypothetical protein
LVPELFYFRLRVVTRIVNMFIIPVVAAMLIFAILSRARLLPSVVRVTRTLISLLSGLWLVCFYRIMVLVSLVI